MANKEIVLNFKAKVSTDVGDIKKILASLETQMGELTIPEANFKTFKNTLEKINKELLNFEALTEKGTDNLTDTKKIEKSWNKVTDLLFNVQSQLKNMGSEVDIFPKSVLTNIDKATTLLGKYNEKLKAVRESEAYTAKAAEVSSKKKETSAAKKRVERATNTAQDKQIRATVAEEVWKSREQDYNEKEAQKLRKKAERENEERFLQEQIEERQKMRRSKMFTAEGEISSSVYTEVKNAQEETAKKQKKLEQAQKEFNVASKQAANAKGQVTRYKNKTKKSDDELKTDQKYLDLLDRSKTKTKERTAAETKLAKATQEHQTAQDLLTASLLKRDAAETVYSNINSSSQRVSELKKEENALKDVNKENENYRRANAEAQRQLQLANAEVTKATNAYSQCEQAVDQLDQELKQMEVDQTTQEWNELVQAIKEITGVDLSDFAGDVGEAVKALEKYKLDEIEKTPSVAKQAETAFEGMAPAIKNVTNAADDLNRELTETERRAQEIAQVKDNIMDFFSISNTIDIFKDSVRNAFDTVKELDAVMTEMAVVTDYSIEDMWGKLPEYSRMASELGVATKEFYQAITLYFQQGLTEEQSVGLAIETLKMGRIAGMEGAEATEAMTAALRGFNMEINQINAQRVNDVYSKLAAITASDTNQIATAISKTASIASSANMDLETTAAFLAQIIETTQEAPETAGTALKTIIARFSEVKELQNSGQMTGTDEEGEEIDVNKIEEALKTVGISMDKFFAGEEGLDKIFLELSKKWKSLDFETRHYIATIAAGSRQQSRFIAMMSDYDRTVELVGAAYDSTGASQEQFDETMESLSSKLNQLHNAWTTFTMGLANSEIIKGVIDFLTNVLNTINEITEALSGSNGLIRSVFNALTLLTGLSLGKRVLTGTGGFIGSILTGGTASGAAGGILGSKMSTNKIMSWLLGASLGGFISEKVSDLFSKDDEDESEKEQSKEKTVIINETDNSDNSNNSVDNSDNSTNTSEVVNNYLKPELEKEKSEKEEKTEGQQLLEAFRSGQITADQMDSETTSKIMEALNAENETLKQIEKNTSSEETKSQASIPEEEDIGESIESETKSENEEQKINWVQILSGIAGLVTTVGSQMLVEAGGQFLAKKFLGKSGEKIVGDVTDAATKKKKNSQTDMSIFGPISDLSILSEVAQATSATNKKGKLKNFLNQKGGIKSLVTENGEVKKVTQKLNDVVESLASFAEKQYSKVPSKSIRSSEYQDAILKWADLNNKTIKELTDEELELFKNASYFDSKAFDIPRLNRSEFTDPKEYIIEVVKEYFPYAWSTIKEKVSTGLATATPYLGTAASAAAVIAPIVVAAGLTQQAYQASSAEGRLENYQKIQTERQGNLTEEQNYLNELNSAKSTYDSLVALAEDFEEGTDEAKWAMSEIERHTDSLLKKYPQLAKQAKKIAPENASDIFKEENWNQITAETEKKVEQAQLYVDISGKEVENLTKEIIIKNLMIGNEDVFTRGRYKMAEFANSGALKSYDSVSEDNYDYLDEYYKDVTKGTQEQFTYMLEAIAQTGLTFTEDYVQNAEILINNEKQVRDAFNQILESNGIKLSDWQAEGEDLFGTLYYHLDLTNYTLVNETLSALRNFTDSTNAAAAASDAKAAADNAAVQRINSQDLIDAAVSRYRESNTSDPVSYSTQQAEAAAARTASTPTSDSSAADAAWENNFDRLYNLIEAIEEETRQQQRIESRYELMMRTFGATVDKILEINIQELTSLERQRQYQEELIKQRMADITMLQLQNMNLAGYASVQKNVHGDSVLRIDWNAIEQITDDALGQAVNEYINQLQEWLDAIYEAEDTLIDIENSVLDIKERGKEEYLNFENRVKDALESYYQEEIDQLSTINDTIEDTNSRLIDSIQKYIDDQRKERQNERTEKDLEKKQRRLSYLRQDTSNANQTEILTLQEEITLEQEDYTDTLIDQRISELQEQNDLAQEQRQHQIEIAQAQLEHYVSTGEIWNEVKQLMEDGFDHENGVLRGSRLIDILKQADNFQGLSSVAQMDWLNDLTNQAKLAQSWTLASALYQRQESVVLGQIREEIANLDVGTTVNNYYTTGSGSSSSGYGNSGYGGSSGGYTGSPTIPTYPSVSNTSNSNSNNSSDSPKRFYIRVPAQSFFTGGDFTGTTVEEAMGKAINQLTKEFNNAYRKTSNIPGLGEEQKLAWQKELIQTHAALVKFIRNTSNYHRYKTGGLADFTGPAWLDGTKAKPEYVLNSVQTKGFLTLVDVLESIKSNSFAPKSENAVGNTYDIDINIETVKEEADIDKIAEKVQKSIVIASQYRSNTVIKR